MEEIVSTDILDKEIYEDARRKAEKILQNSKLQCEQVLQQVDDRLEKAKEERKEYYDHKADVFKKNLESSLPLEKSRFLVSYINSSIIESINDYLKKLGEEKRLSLVISMLRRFGSIKDFKTFSAEIYGFDVNSAEKKLKSESGLNISSTEKIDFMKSGETPVEGIDIHEGIILVSDDRSLKIRLTLEEYVSELTDKYRNELAVTLFNGRLPE
ncbi:MAG: hypothetical protein IK002_00950 [Treponema sp.]|uniref:hypothetical protein n=1 Tax=Treponema sp. TaxID=166 RepID=UPI00298EAEE0|nr:hypothetical protein [Treponema sp.]MBR5932533.1 hypothetical protein [Treponema sp.]